MFSSNKKLALLDQCIEPLVYDFKKNVGHEIDIIRSEANAKGLYPSGSYFKVIAERLLQSIKTVSEKILALIENSKKMKDTSR